MPTTAQKPRYVRIADELREKIRGGELKVGDRLPSYAEMYREHGVTPATMQRVCELLEQDELIERRHSSGVYVSSPRRKRTFNIGFIGSTSHIVPSVPFTVDFMDGVYAALKANQEHFLYLGSPESWDTAAAAKVDGVLLSNVANPGGYRELLPPGMPLVSALSFDKRVTCIGIDDFYAGQLAVQHLVSLGHRRIACLMEKSPYEPRRRFAGYNDALFEAGIQSEPGWVRVNDSGPRTPQTTSVQLYREWACWNMDRWLEENWHDLKCTAIVVQNEIAGIGVIQAFQRAGIRVPQEVSVIGFDGTDLGNLVSPRLTCVAQPMALIGATAIEELNRLITGESVQEQTILLPVNLMAGESVAPAI